MQAERGTSGLFIIYIKCYKLVHSIAGRKRHGRDGYNSYKALQTS